MRARMTSSAGPVNSAQYSRDSGIVIVRNREALESVCPDARERAGPVFPPPPVGEEETQAKESVSLGQRIWDKEYGTKNLSVCAFDFQVFRRYLAPVKMDKNNILNI